MVLLDLDSDSDSDENLSDRSMPRLVPQNRSSEREREHDSSSSDDDSNSNSSMPGLQERETDYSSSSDENDSGSERVRARNVRRARHVRARNLRRAILLDADSDSDDDDDDDDDDNDRMPGLIARNLVNEDSSSDDDDNDIDNDSATEHDQIQLPFVFDVDNRHTIYNIHTIPNQLWPILLERTNTANRFIINGIHHKPSGLYYLLRKGPLLIQR